MQGWDLDGVDGLSTADPGGMLGRVEGFEDQCREAIEIGRNAPLPPKSTFRNIVMAGMGGSAIGGDLLRTCFGGDFRQPWTVSRDYDLPGWVGKETLLLAASYSGNTEETLQAFEAGLSRGATVVCLTSGGELEKRARERDLPVVRIPGGLPPRAALGYSFFPLAVVLGRLGLASVADAALTEALGAIGRCREESGNSRPEADNRAKTLARSLRGYLPLIYSGNGLLSSVALRWKGQLNENAKQLAYTNVFPEVNHNEIEGWEAIGEPGRRIHLILLRDTEDSPRIRLRMDVTAEIIGDRAGRITELWSTGEGRMARMFSLVCLGDFVSVYLALLSGVDPTPVENITRLKKVLAGSAQ